MFRIPTLAIALATTLTTTLTTTLFSSSLLAQDTSTYFPSVVGYQGPRIITVVVKVDGKELQIRIQGDKVKAYLDGDRIARKNIETKGTERSIRNEDGRRMATVEIDRGYLATRPMPVAKNRARLGLTLGCIDEALARHLDLDREDVRIVQQVTKGAAAEKADIKKHDVLLRIDGRAPVTENIVRKILSKKKPGDKLCLRILRRGGERDVEVTLDKTPAPKSTGFQSLDLGTRYLTLVDPSTLAVADNQLMLTPGKGVLGTLIQDQALLPDRALLKTEPKKLEATLENLEKEIGELRKRSERLEKLLRELTRKRDR